MCNDVWVALHRLSCAVENLAENRVVFGFEVPGGAPAAATNDRTISALNNINQMYMDTFIETLKSLWGSVPLNIREELNFHAMTSSEMVVYNDYFWNFDNDDSKGFYFCIKQSDEEEFPAKLQIYRASDLEQNNLQNTLFTARHNVPALVRTFLHNHCGVPLHCLEDDYAEHKWFMDDKPRVTALNVIFSDLIKTFQPKANVTFKGISLPPKKQESLWKLTILQSCLLFFITANIKHTKKPHIFPIPEFKKDREKIILDWDDDTITATDNGFQSRILNSIIRDTPGGFVMHALSQWFTTLKTKVSDIQMLSQMSNPSPEIIHKLTTVLYLHDPPPRTAWDRVLADSAKPRQPMKGYEEDPPSIQFFQIMGM